MSLTVEILSGALIPEEFEKLVFYIKDVMDSISEEDKRYFEKIIDKLEKAK